jgi:Protein of unknown function (DUF4446)
MPLYLVSLAALIVSAIALAAVLGAWLNLRSFNRLRESFFGQSGHGNLEDVINSLVKSYHDLEQRQTALEQHQAQLKTNFNLAVQKVGVVRFNPFAGSGGNFSFSIALLDGRNTGVVITSMHGREQNRIYTKKIQEGGSETVLTEEEQQAINRAADLHHRQII